MYSEIKTKLEANAVRVFGPCIWCDTQIVFYVPTDEWDKWSEGRGPFIQEAMPSVSADNREFLISGSCGDCYDEIFAEGEEPNEYCEHDWHTHPSGIVFCNNCGEPRNA